MSESHKQNLPIIASHADRIGYTFGKIEASLGYTGERCDLWAMARRPIAAAFAEHPEAIDRGAPPMVDLVRGSTAVFEYKKTVADLRADQGKPWRKPGARALGERRFYCIEAGGEVRPEHIPEVTGWGIIIFNAHQYGIARPSAFHPCLYRDTIELAVQVSESKRRPDFAGADFTNASPQDYESTSAPKAEDPAPPRRKLKPWIVTVRSYLKAGPATTAQLTRILEQELGLRYTAAKLAKELRAARLFDQDGAGGSWTIKEKEVKA